jgi:hypothetical protein
MSDLRTQPVNAILEQHEYREQRAPVRRIARGRLKLAVFIICFLAFSWVYRGGLWAAAKVLFHQLKPLPP